MRWLLGLVLTGCAVSFEDYPVERGAAVVVEADAGSEESFAVRFGGGRIGAEAGSDAGDGTECLTHYLRFSGTDGSYVAFFGVPSLDPPFTVELWVRTGPNESIDLTHVGPEDPCGWGFRISDNEVSAGITAAFGHFVQPIPSTEWRHVAWTYDGAESVIFVDGEVAGRKEAAAPIGLPGHCSGPMTIGAVLDGAGTPYAWGTGEVDEVRTSRAIVYSGGFVPQRQLEVLSDTVGLWRFDENSGTELYAVVGSDGQMLGDVSRACD